MERQTSLLRAGHSPGGARERTDPHYLRGSRDTSWSVSLRKRAGSLVMKPRGPVWGEDRTGTAGGGGAGVGGGLARSPAGLTPGNLLI